MAIDPKKLAAFASQKGPQINKLKVKFHKPEEDMEDENEEEGDDYEEEDDQDEGDEESEESRSEEPEWADEMDGWFDSLYSEYPELEHYVNDLAEELQEEDYEEASKALESMLEYMSEEMNQSYPKLSDEERKQAGENIKEHMGHLEEHQGGPSQAIAIGLRQAAPGKYDSYEKHR